jgi:3-deoxy-D-manno-octulosonic-acid transferase
MRYLYSAIFYLALPLVLLRLLWRSRRAPAYRRRLPERFGFFAPPPTDGRRVIWVHAVSVGEVVAAAPLVEDLLERHADHRLVLTTTTPTGSERARALFGARVFHVYAPWDLPGAVARFMARTQPRLLVLMETELWPNMLYRAARQGTRVVLANARMSARSARGYARLQPLTRGMLAAVDRIACQSPADARRLRELGATAAAVTVTGSIKFDLELDAGLRQQAQELRRAWAAQQRPIIVAASTHPGEDELVLDAFAEVRERVDNALLLLVPRHPERFDAVVDLCVRRGWRVVRRSTGDAPGLVDDVVVGDTMGELLLLLSVGRLVVMGGSLVPRGGHNVLEAAAWGIPVITGPHMFNFAAISDLLGAAGGMLMLEQPARLGQVLLELLQDAGRARRMGAAGQQVVADNRGARCRLRELLEEQLAAA